MAAKWKSTEDDGNLGGDLVKNADPKKGKISKLDGKEDEKQECALPSFKAEEKGSSCFQTILSYCCESVYVRGL